MSSFSSPLFQALQSQTAEVAQLYDQWQGLTHGVQTAMPAFGRGTQPHIVQDTFNNMVGASGAFMRFMEFWQPIVEAAQVQDLEKKKPSRTSSAASQALSTLITVERYKPVMDSAFDFATPERLQEYLERLTVFAGRVGGAAKATTTQASISSNPLRFVPAMPPVRRRVVTRTTELMEQLLRYAHSFVRYRDMLYAHGLQVAHGLAHELVAQPAIFSTYSQFFSLWIRRNEEEYAMLFRTSEFIATQNQLSTDVVATHTAFQSLMETLLEDSPLATRSQMDALHKAVHDLKRDVRNFMKARTAFIS
jgi:hypothetical protein